MSDPEKYLHWGRLSLSELGKMGGTGQQSDVPMTGDFFQNWLASRSPSTPNVSHVQPWAGGQTPTQILPGGVPMYGFNEDTQTPRSVTDLWLRNLAQRLSSLGQ